MTSVLLQDGENQESLLRRFQKLVQNSGVLSEVKQRRHFISNGEKARIAKRKAARRRRKHSS